MSWRHSWLLKLRAALFINPSVGGQEIISLFLISLLREINLSLLPTDRIEITPSYTTTHSDTVNIHLYLESRGSAWCKKMIYWVAGFSIHNKQRAPCKSHLKSIAWKEERKRWDQGCLSRHNLLLYYSPTHGVRRRCGCWRMTEHMQTQDRQNHPCMSGNAWNNKWIQI